MIVLFKNNHHMKAKTTQLVVLFYLIFSLEMSAQNFTRITDTNNPLSQTDLLDYWTGATWIDIDNDNDLDLFLTNRQPGTTPKKNRLYLNDGNNFIQLNTGILVNDLGYWFGASWGDYDNDGDVDVHVAGYPARLYRNEGDGQFTKITAGEIGLNTLAGISTAWGDFNNDGYLDLFTVWPNWMPGAPWTGAPAAPHLMINSGPPNFTFSRLLNTPVTDSGDDTYLHPSLSDFDDVGDLDIFIGMGAGLGKPDLLFRNLLTESGNLAFEKMDDILIATDLVEGNQWTWVDIDNDGDNDAFLTNWAHVVDGVQMPQKNNLYINENGTFTKITNDIISTDEDLSTSHTWGDYDNDGDLDCIVVTDSTYLLRYYQNDGAGHFVHLNAGELSATNFHQSGCSNGDFDGDGDLDLFIPGPGSHNAFFRNDLENENHWIRFKLNGTQSNRSGIGAKLFVKSIINGNAIWQRREVSASNTFFGHNSIWQHFGLGDAELLDSLQVTWPSGIVDQYTLLEVDTIFSLTEGETTSPTSVYGQEEEMNVARIFPNPSGCRFMLEISIESNSRFEIMVVHSATGKVVYRSPERSSINGMLRKEIYLRKKVASGLHIVMLNINGISKVAGKVMVNK